MALKIFHHKQNEYEKVIEFSDDTGFICYIAIHNTNLGPGLGGCRVKSYPTNEEALADCLRLAKGMTYKSSLAGLNFGGAKCVINAPKATRDNMLKVGEAIEYFKGHYISAEDIGTTLSHVQIMREVTQHTAQLDGSSMTARGVLACMKAAVKYKQWDFDDLYIWIQGLGKVGMDLVKRLNDEEMAQDILLKLCVSDIRKNAVDEAKTNFDAVEYNEKIHTIDIYAPCAMGQVINADNIDTVRYGIICGSANNQLVEESYGEILKANNVLYCPDWLVNAGGVINASCEIGRPFDQKECEDMTDALGNRLTEVLITSDKENKTPLYIAMRMAESRFM